MKFKMVEEMESIYIERGEDTPQKDIDDFIKFIWRQAEKRGFIVNNKERYENEGRELDRNRRGNVQLNGMGEGT
tara:strand:- start:275 stop:496 length:222 start_codon:yes stop_codon:yes gene_type:complete